MSTVTRARVCVELQSVEQLARAQAKQRLTRLTLTHLPVGRLIAVLRYRGRRCVES
jgi:hypothetical protein